MATPDSGGQQDARSADSGHEPGPSEIGHNPARSLDRLESSQAAMRETTKWLIAAAAAVGAVLVAGLQLKDLPHGFIAASVALLGVAAALVAVAFILYRAAGVLAAGYTTFGEILELDKDKNYLADQLKAADWGARIIDIESPKGSPTDRRAGRSWKALLPILRWCAPVVVPPMRGIQGHLLRRAREEGIRIRDLLDYLNRDTFYFTQGLAGNIQELNRVLREADERILTLRGEKTGRGGRASDGAVENTGPPADQAPLGKLEWRQERLESAMNVLISFANQRLLVQRFRKLLAAIFIGGSIIALGAGAFVVAPKLGKPEALSITHPTQVTVRVVGKGLGRFCPPGTLLRGVAVGGTWDEPIVVTETAGACPAKEMTLNNGQAVIAPVLEPSSAGSTTP